MLPSVILAYSSLSSPLFKNLESELPKAPIPLFNPRSTKKKHFKLYENYMPLKKACQAKRESFLDLVLFSHPLLFTCHIEGIIV